MAVSATLLVLCGVPLSQAVILVPHCWSCTVYHWVRQWFWCHTAGVLRCTTESGSDFGATLLELCRVPLSQAVILVPHCWSCTVYHWVRQWFWCHTAGVLRCTTESGSDFCATLLELCGVPLSQAVILVPHCWSCTVYHRVEQWFCCHIAGVVHVPLCRAVILVPHCWCCAVYCRFGQWFWSGPACVPCLMNGITCLLVDWRMNKWRLNFYRRSVDSVVVVAISASTSLFRCLSPLSLRPFLLSFVLLEMLLSLWIVLCIIVLDLCMHLYVE